MLRFFRKMRRDLIETNRFAKYLLYAGGEILLVVIGILIALQVNTWNEERKNRRLALYYSERLKEDFRILRDLSHAAMVEEDATASFSHLIYSACIGDTTDIDPNLLAIGILRSSWLKAISLESQTWNELLSSGKVNLFDGSILPKLMADYRADTELFRYHEEEWSSYRLEFKRAAYGVLTPGDIDKVILSDWGGFQPMDSIEAIDLGLESELEEMTTRLRARPNLVYLLGNVWNTREMTMANIRNLAFIQDSILKVLDMEIERLESYSR